MKILCFILEVSKVQVKIPPDQQDKENLLKNSDMGQSSIDICEIRGIFQDHAVKEISLFENLMIFFRQINTIFLVDGQLDGLNETFLNSYSSMLDCVLFEVFQGNQIDNNLLVDSTNLVVIFKYLKIIFQRLTSIFLYIINDRC